jgi:hypothetical protein
VTRRRLVAAAALAAALVITPLAGADPPAVSITGGPSGVVTTSSATFDFTVDDPSATVECTLDGSAGSCSSGVSYSGLSDGSHTFVVRATNAGSETGSDSRSWTVDTSGPVLSLPDVVQNVDDVPSAVVTFSPGGSDPHGPVTVTCTPASGSTFPLGATTVACTGTDGLGNASSGSFTVTVRDVTPPTVTTPGTTTVSVNGVTTATVSFTVTSSAGTPSCTPPSGSSFPLGTTTVSCSATDASGNTGSASFSVIVQDVTPPTLTLPATQTVNVNASTTVAVTYSATAADGATPITPACTPPSGSTFSLGTTSVSCTATDAAGNTASGSFNVVVQDTTPPTVSISSGPSGTVANATASFSFTANEGSLACALDGASFASCSSPQAYAGLGDGSHTFRVRATDAGGNAATATRTWSVDTTPPTFSTPGTLTLEANGPSGAVASFSVTAADDGVPLLPGAVTCSPTSGSLFPLGTTPVQCSAADTLGNVGTASFDVVVRDTTPPTLIVAGITVAATTDAGIRRTDPAMASYLRSLRATDVVSPSVVVTTDAPDLFPVGTTPLTIRAVDGAGNTSKRTVTVTVLALGQTAPPPPDLDPPSDVTRLRATTGDHVVTLAWTTPPAPDLASIEVRMSVVGELGSEKVVSRAIRSVLTVKGLRNGLTYRFLVVTVDRAGNRSRGAIVQATPRAQRLVTPKPGTKVQRPPLLRWVPVPGATYFNVQLFRGKTKLFSAWPTRARLQLTRTWTYDKLRRTLAAGTYTWYVWPGFGDRRDVKYGELIGKSSFVVVRTKKDV